MQHHILAGRKKPMIDGEMFFLINLIADSFVVKIRAICRPFLFDTDFIGLHSYDKMGLRICCQYIEKIQWPKANGII